MSRADSGPVRGPARPDPLLEARSTFELSSRALEAGDGVGAAAILDAGAKALREARSTGVRGPAALVLADNMAARAAAYGEVVPAKLHDRAQRLVEASSRARELARALRAADPAAADQLDEVGLESRLQAELLFQAGAGTDVLLGRGVAQTYRAIVDASFAKTIGDAGALNNLITGKRDALAADRKKAGEVFAYLERVMEQRGVSFDRAWKAMFEDHHLGDRGALPSFATPSDAAAFLRDHEVTRGLLSPMCDLAHGLTEGDGAGVDRARAGVVRVLREHGQWQLAREVLDDLQQHARSPEGRQDAQALDASERREWWRQKAGELVQKDLPVLLLAGIVSGGVGVGAGALASAAGWSARAARVAQVGGELLSFVPTERVLSDVLAGRRADWSAGGMARDYALTAAGYGLFRALGAGWRALRAPRLVKPKVPDPAAVPTGRPATWHAGDNESTVSGRMRENESAQVLAREGYPVEQNPEIPGGKAAGVKHPDFRIAGELFDNLAPRSPSARNAWSRAADKVAKDQARRLVLNLSDSKITLDALRKQFAEWHIPNLEQVLVVQNGKVFELTLAKPPPPWVTPKGYPHEE